jgi:transposase InsO family protein
VLGHDVAVKAHLRKFGCNGYDHLLARIVHERSRGTYGAPRVHAALRKEGIATSGKRVARLMREQGLQGRRKRRFKRTTIADPEAAAAVDLIKRAFGPGTITIDQCWCSDITYVRTWEGWQRSLVQIQPAQREK